MVEDSVPGLGKKKRKLEKEAAVEPEQKNTEKEKIESVPKKKRVRGIVKKAMAELEAEREAKRSMAAATRKVKSSKTKTAKSKKSRKIQ